MSANEKPNRRRRGIYLLPNLLTTGGLFAGFFSIIAAIDGNFAKSAIAIFVAMALDGMDGRLARLTSTETDFGKEFDSLADMVSFGLAPSIVTYQWGVARLSEYGAAWERVGWLCAFLFTVAAAFRLARFNTRSASKDNRFFEGLPSPSAAGGVAAMVWLSTKYEIDGLVALATGAGVTMAAGLLMMSGFSYYSFKDINTAAKVPFQALLLPVSVLLVISLNPPVVCFAMFLMYASSGPLLWLWRWRKRKATSQPEHSQS